MHESFEFRGQKCVFLYLSSTYYLETGSLSESLDNKPQNLLTPSSLPGLNAHVTILRFLPGFWGSNLRCSSFCKEQDSHYPLLSPIITSQMSVTGIQCIDYDYWIHVSTRKSTLFKFPGSSLTFLLQAST